MPILQNFAVFFSLAQGGLTIGLIELAYGLYMSVEYVQALMSKDVDINGWVLDSDTARFELALQNKLNIFSVTLHILLSLTSILLIYGALKEKKLLVLSQFLIETVLAFSTLFNLVTQPFMGPDFLDWFVPFVRLVFASYFAVCVFSLYQEISDRYLPTSLKK